MASGEHDLHNELSALREQVESLSQQLTALQARLAAPELRNKSMRAQNCCPACGCTRLLHANAILDRGEGNMRHAMKLVNLSWWRDKSVGQFESYICTQCGIVEWYVNLAGVEADGEHLQLIEKPPTDPTGPYR